MLEALERKLSYDDLRFYRSIARSQLRKDMATRRKLEEERKRQQPQKQTSWSSWIWGSSDGAGTGAGAGAARGDRRDARGEVRERVPEPEAGDDDREHDALRAYQSALSFPLHALPPEPRGEV